MNRSLTITATGQSGYIDLYATSTKVFIYYVGGATGTMTPQISKRQGEVIAQELPNGDTTITGSNAFVVDGPGQLSFSVASVSGTIKVEVEEAL